MSNANVSNQVQLFNFNENEIRIIIQENGEPLFHAKDITDALGYSNSSKAIADHVKPKHKHNVSLGLPGQSPTFITEPGLYALTLKAKTEKAEVFQDWVTENVLPDIRKTGKFSSQKELSRMDILQIAMEAEKENQQLKTAVAYLEPKAQAFNHMMDTEGETPLDEAAKVLNTGRTRLIKLLKVNGMFFMDRPIPKQKYVDNKWFIVKSALCGDGQYRAQTFVTHKGMTEIHNIMFGNSQHRLN